MKNLNIIIENIAHLLNLATTKEEAIEKGYDYYLELEYASCYGGYRLNNVNTTNGGHIGAFGESSACSRRSLKEMTAYLNGVYNGAKSAKKEIRTEI
jgi:hypothetical protein